MHEPLVVVQCTQAAVLLDRDAVTSGAAAAGQPWQHYDVGHWMQSGSTRIAVA